MTSVQLSTEFADSAEVRSVIQLKGYFKGSCNGWDHALDGVMHQDLALCAIGGLTSHLSRLMVRFSHCSFSNAWEHQYA